MNEYGGVTFDEVAKAFKNISEKLYEQRQSGYEELYEKIALLSDKEFADEVVSIVGAEKNIYDLSVMYERMYDAIKLLSAGITKGELIVLLENHTEQIAVRLIREVN